MNEIDSGNLPNVRRAPKKSRRTITSGMDKSTSGCTTGSKYKAKSILKELSATKRPPYK